MANRQINHASMHFTNFLLQLFKLVAMSTFCDSEFPKLDLDVCYKITHRMHFKALRKLQLPGTSGGPCLPHFSVLGYMGPANHFDDPPPKNISRGINCRLSYFFAHFYLEIEGS